MGGWNKGSVKYPTLADVVRGIYEHAREDNGCLISTRRANVNGYACQVFQGRQWLAHRLVAEHHYGPCPEGQEVRHLCGRGRDGCVKAEHLCYGTSSENAADSVRLGRQSLPGKLSAEDLALARSMREQGLSYKRIGARLGRSGDAMRKALNGITYKRFSPVERIEREAPILTEVSRETVRQGVLW